MIDSEHRSRLPRNLIQILSSRSTAVSVCDISAPERQLIYVNDAFCHLTGYWPDECVGRNCNFLQGDASQPQENAAIRQALKAREPMEITLKNYRRSGEMFLNFLILSPAPSHDGRELYFGCQFDATDAPDHTAQAAADQHRENVSKIVASARSAIDTSRMLKFYSWRNKASSISLSASTALARSAAGSPGPAPVAKRQSTPEEG